VEKQKDGKRRKRRKEKKKSVLVPCSPADELLYPTTTTTTTTTTTSPIIHQSIILCNKSRKRKKKKEKERKKKEKNEKLSFGLTHTGCFHLPQSRQRERLSYFCTADELCVSSPCTSSFDDRLGHVLCVFVILYRFHIIVSESNVKH
jgi:hypothetical protein